MTETEETLRYWLAQEDWYPSRYTQNFLDNNAVEVANNTLASISADAQPEPHSYAALLYTAFATIGFMPSAGGKIPRRKAGVRASLLLADRNDPRAIPALARVFETEGVWQNKYQDQIVSALTKALSADNHGQSAIYADDVSRLARRIWSSAPGRDLTAPFARLLLAAIRFLHMIRRGDPLLPEIAAAPSRQELRSHVRDIVVSLLDNGTPPR
ncbi:MAG: hypothetical protein H8F28_24775 [Fibrella sp.]|nr:hypothetical protein [Armatimonadota bacterium]